MSAAQTPGPNDFYIVAALPITTDMSATTRATLFFLFLLFMALWGAIMPNFTNRHKPCYRWLRQAVLVLCLGISPIVAFVGQARAVVVVPVLQNVKQVVSGSEFFRADTGQVNVSEGFINPSIPTAVPRSESVDVINIPIDHEQAFGLPYFCNRFGVDREGREISEVVIRHQKCFGGLAVAPHPVVRLLRQNLMFLQNQLPEKYISHARGRSAKVLNLNFQPIPVVCDYARPDHTGCFVRHFHVSALRITHSLDGSQGGASGLIGYEPQRESKIRDESRRDGGNNTIVGVNKIAAANKSGRSAIEQRHYEIGLTFFAIFFGSFLALFLNAGRRGGR